LFPPAARRLSQDQLRHLAFSGNLNQCAGNIPTTGVYYFGSQVFGQRRVLFPALSGHLSLPFGLFAELEQPNHTRAEGVIPGRLNGNGDEVSVQTMCQTPGCANYLARMRAMIEADQYAFARGPALFDAVFR